MVKVDSIQTKCTLCDEVFQSKTKLFRHLESAHAIEGSSSKPQKIVLLVGWLSPYQESEELTEEHWIKDAPLSAHVDQTMIHVENTLFRAIYALDHGLLDVSEIPSDTIIERPKGLTRASSSAQRSSFVLGMESSNHACCDVFCFQANRWGGTDIEWVEKVNSFIPAGDVHVIEKIILPQDAFNFHAEICASQRRFEFMLPLNLVMPPELAIKPESYVPRKVKPWETVMDKNFPGDEEMGQIRIAYFRKLKHLLKMFSDDHKRSFHNFAAGGASPDDVVCRRLINRVFHKEMVAHSTTTTSTASAPSLATDAGTGNWVIFSASGDSFLRGQVRKIMGLTMSIMRGWLPFDFLHTALHPEAVVDIPSAPGWAVYLDECKFAFFEAKYGEGSPQQLFLDPRRRRRRTFPKPSSFSNENHYLNPSFTFDSSVHSSSQLESFEATQLSLNRLTDWRRRLHTHIMSIQERVGHGWVDRMREQCFQIMEKRERLLTLLTSRGLLVVKKQEEKKKQSQEEKEIIMSKGEEEEEEEKIINKEEEEEDIEEEEARGAMKIEGEEEGDKEEEKVGEKEEEGEGSGHILEPLITSPLFQEIFYQEFGREKAEKIKEWVRITGQVYTPSPSSIAAAAASLKEEEERKEEEAGGGKKKNHNNKKTSFVMKGKGGRGGKSQQQQTNNNNPQTQDSSLESNQSMKTDDIDNTDRPTIDPINNNQQETTTTTEQVQKNKNKKRKQQQQSLSKQQQQPQLPQNQEQVQEGEREERERGEDVHSQIPTTITTADELTLKSISPSSLPVSLPVPLPPHPYLHDLSSVPLAYHKVLTLLREACTSGLWPASSLARRSVMVKERVSEEGGEGGVGGTFSVGALPKHLCQPKGNILFPALMKACFELELALCPDRPPSSTIAINRHAQFLPHRDSGAGNGQSTSLIVALGDFVGGEIVIENIAHDIRYKPTLFDGWSDRHWTLPFEGERFSLVWFTPLGVSEEDMWWWKE